MPSIVAAPIKIIDVTANSTVNIGDALQITPKSTSKTYTGSGGGNIGDLSVSVSVFSSTNTFDPDAIDSANIADN
ncbi:spore germination protein [Paenibacillus hamazuiensis]|uniref:spore germination protein n=1 Tax=Paenibacillus hamazuiensis TaxID=2936508 RepID=UPI00200E77E8|nr:spore germination protein [Paenibacillus hamazuiensis]